MTVKQRLKEYLKYKGVNASEFGRTIGVSSAFVSSIRVSVQPDKVERIALYYPDLNIEWLLTGEGSMLKCADLYVKEKTPSIIIEKDWLKSNIDRLMEDSGRNSRSIEKMVETADRNSQTLAKLIDLLCQNEVGLSNA